jgi:hypothetical protein
MVHLQGAQVMDIDANTLALGAMIIGGAELRLAVSRLTSRIELVEQRSMAAHVKRAAPLLLIWCLAAGAVCCGAETVTVTETVTETIKSGAAGAAAGAPFGPVGLAVGAAVGVLVSLVGYRWHKERRK